MRVVSIGRRVAVYGLLIIEHYQWRIHWHPTNESGVPVRGMIFVVFAERIKKNSPTHEPEQISREEEILTTAGERYDNRYLCFSPRR